MRFFAYAAAIMFSLVSISAVNDADTEILLPTYLKENEFCHCRPRTYIDNNSGFSSDLG